MYTDALGVMQQLMDVYNVAAPEDESLFRYRSSTFHVSPWAREPTLHTPRCIPPRCDLCGGGPASYHGVGSGLHMYDPARYVRYGRHGHEWKRYGDLGGREGEVGRWQHSAA